MKRPYVAGLSPSATPAAGTRASSALMKVGMNTGNLLFTHAIHRIVNPHQTPPAYNFDPGYVRDNHDGIVVPAANWLSPRATWAADFASRVRSTGVPCVIVGLGSQSHSPDVLPAVNEGIVDLIRIADETSRSISVRGDYTAKVLSHLGIQNFRVTGCPSLLWRVDRPAHVVKKTFEPGKVVLTGSRGIPTESVFLPNVESSRLSLLMSRLALKRDLDFVAQAELPDLGYVLGNPDDDTPSGRDYLCRVFGTNDWSRIHRFLVRNVKVFFSVSEWIDFLATRSFTVGTRLHGAIASLLAGTPALLIAHDARTIESARRLCIPFRHSGEFQRIRDFDFERLYDDVDFAEFNNSGIEYFRRFGEFLQENEVPFSFSNTTA